MALDKILELDMSELFTEQGLTMLDEQLGSVEDELKKAGKKPKQKQQKKGLLSQFEKQDQKTEKRLAKLQKQLEFDTISGKQSRNLKDKLFPGNVLSNLLKLQNPTSFFSSTLLKMIPALGAIIAVTGIFVSLAKKVDDFQKKFVDSVDDRIDLFRSKQQQALIQAGLAQEIFTTSAGGTEPRDAYNTFEQFNNNQAAIERDFELRNTSGVD